MAGADRTAVTQPFTVDLRHAVDVLADHVYSGPHVYLRELVQNAVDAVTARRHEGRVRVRLHGERRRPALTVVDDGVGLTADEAAAALGRVGGDTKRDRRGPPRCDLIGQLGIGLLSCFVVSDRVVLTSRSARGGDPIRWEGRVDGTWCLGPGPDGHPVGSRVTVESRHGQERWFHPELVVRHLRHHGELLRVPVEVDLGDGSPVVPVTRDVGPLRDVLEPAAMRALAAELLGVEPLRVFSVTSPSTLTYGIAAVVPHPDPPGARRRDRVYVRGMLVDPDCDRLLPDGVGFVRCVVDSDGLRPTASRERLHDDEVLDVARRELLASVRAHLAEPGGRR